MGNPAQIKGFREADGAAAIKTAGFDDWSAPVRVALTPFGRTGPLCDAPATASTLLALGGYTAIAGDPDRAPLTLPGHYVEFQSGGYAFAAANAARLAGERHAIDIGMLEVIASLSQFTTVLWSCKGEIRQRELVKNALRMRPDRVILGEVRGEEAFDMLQAMNTGHEGSMATIHANTPRDAITRLENMVSMAGTNMSEVSVRHQISSAVRIIVQLTRFSDGKRRLTSVSEITGMEGEVITMQEIFRYEKVGVDETGKVRGRFLATGVRPQCCGKLEAAGIAVDPRLFEGRVDV